MDRFKFKAWENRFKCKEWGNRFKFKAWGINTEEFMKLPNGSTELTFQNLGSLPLESGDWKIVQFIGLQDKKGKLICEGDIIKCTCDGEVQLKEVVWGEEYNYPAFDLLPHTTKDEEANLFSVYLNGLDTCDRSLEIIGNIYENRDLLEVENE
tara:strand:+ start:10477 stop:10935 length:459 start_codon:yes stop_codon:yes gene_type:complete